MSEYAFEGPKRASTTITWSFATQTYVADAAHPFTSAIASAYQSTIQAAFARWASVSDLTFVQSADSASVAIRIGFSTFSVANRIGETDFTYGSGTIANDTVVRLEDPAATALTRDAAGNWVYAGGAYSLYQLALHEIGHALGLDHTSDPATIMYPVATSANPDLIIGDVYGINALYPQFTVTAQAPVQAVSATGAIGETFVLTRYSDPAVTLTVTYAVTGSTASTVPGVVAAPATLFGGAYPSGSVTFAAGSITAAVTIAVPATSATAPDYGFKLNVTGALVVTKGSNSATVLNAGAASTLPAGEAAVYRFFDTTDGTHFYTASAGERNTTILTRSDLTYEGIGFPSLASASGSNTVAVYRFFDRSNGTHFYTDSAAEQATVVATRADMAYEGVAFEEYGGPAAGAAAVYRFFDRSNGTHFYTDSATEVASIASTRPDLTAEGIAFYTPAA